MNPAPPRRGWRFPLLLLGFVALASGVGAGLVRFAWTMPSGIVSLAAWHGALMVCGFFGVVISLERAVALGRPWAYGAPLLAGLGTLSVFAGSAIAAGRLYLAASAVLCAATAAVWHRQQQAFVTVLVLGAACWLAGNLLAVWDLASPVPCWIAFLVLTIGGERLELSRFLQRPPAAMKQFVAITTLLLLALPMGWISPSVGGHLLGAALLALAAWLSMHDIARRTVKSEGLTRFIAVALLGGYVWLAIGGATLLVHGWAPASAAHDAALHALMLGFVFAMVFGHAPIVLPSVLGVSLRYRALFYLPLVLLHASVAMRTAGDGLRSPELASAGAMASAVALGAFIVTMAGSVKRA